MKCPLLELGRLANVEELVDQAGDCVRGDCAWWIDDPEECSIYALGTWIGHIADNVAQIREMRGEDKDAHL